VHHDIKADNILVVRESKSQKASVVKINDFDRSIRAEFNGIGDEAYDDDAPFSGHYSGTCCYLSPELIPIYDLLNSGQTSKLKN
jgi:serine/threonine protein kinase